jgi:hypothetical protein
VRSRGTQGVVGGRKLLNASKVVLREENDRETGVSL